jgi:hypothetical protein
MIRSICVPIPYQMYAPQKSTKKHENQGPSALSYTGRVFAYLAQANIPVRLARRARKPAKSAFLRVLLSAPLAIEPQTCLNCERQAGSTENTKIRAHPYDPFDPCSHSLPDVCTTKKHEKARKSGSFGSVVHQAGIRVFGAGRMIRSIRVPIDPYIQRRYPQRWAIGDTPVSLRYWSGLKFILPLFAPSTLYNLLFSLPVADQAVPGEHYP